MVRAFALHAKCRGFESLIAHHPSLKLRLSYGWQAIHTRTRVRGRMSSVALAKEDGTFAAPLELWIASHLFPNYL